MLPILKKYFHKERVIDLEELKVIFERFKKILEGNNVVLELMSQLEDKLSGEYIFDINFLKKIIKQISAEIYKIIYNLNDLSDNKYHDLFARQTEISHELDKILKTFSRQSKTELTVTYDEFNSIIPDIVGGKNANLSEVRNNLKLNTPKGFILTTNAYHQFMKYNSFWPEIKKIYDTMSIHEEGYAEQHDKIIDSIFSKADLPEDLKKSIQHNFKSQFGRFKNDYHYAVRSSAFGEDAAGMSFAGQFRSILNCPRDEIHAAYIKVIASRFSYNSMIYNRELVLDVSKLPMAVGVQQLIPAKTAGIIYSLDPVEEFCDWMVISAGYGLGINIVSGKEKGDFFKVSRLNPNEVLERKISEKYLKMICNKSGSLESIPVEPEFVNRSCLSDGQITELAETALFLDRYFKRPLDIEWCYDQNDKLYILQCRPLKMPSKAIITTKNLQEILEDKTVILYKKGQIAQRGIAAGKVYPINEDDDPALFPAGSIAVSKQTSPRLSAIIRRAQAIVTDVGSLTGHMATVAREFGIPLIINTGNATQILSQGAEITVDAEENIIYEGIIKELLEYETKARDVYRDLKEYKILRQLIRKISPLKLVDPASKSFNVKNCQTYHDILRFSHEKAMQELITINMSSRRFKRIKSKTLQLSIPLDLIVIDLGQGLSADESTEVIKSIAEVNSIPMKAILKGLTAPGIWSTQPVQLGVGDLISSMTRFTITNGMGEYTGQNLAIVSEKYMNISLRLGYHFNVVDAYVSENVNDNYIYFRFVGGVTETERRHLRAILLKDILERLNFKVSVTGDLVVARVKKFEAGRILNILENIGKLIGFSRQLDTQMHNQDSVKKYLNEFFN